MRAEKKFITEQYLEWLRSSSYFVIVDFSGLTVSQFEDLRGRLRGVDAEIHVVKNRILKIAAEENGAEGLDGDMRGQLAVVVGRQDIPSTAKILKNFESEFERPQLRFGYIDNERVDKADLQSLADLPSLDALRSKLLGVIKTPGRKIASIVNEPIVRIPRVIKAYADKGE